MSLWEYKVITSGKGGFATPALLEKFLNDLGRDEWEIVDFQTQPDNFLAFTGLARRPTQRDWTLADAAAAAAKVEADKLRAEFEAKFKAATVAGGTAEAAPSFIEEKAAPDDGFRKPVDTSHDADPEAQEEPAASDDWDSLTAAEEDELPTFFDAIKPHMRRNQRGPGMSVGVDYLAKRWDQTEDDVQGALLECGFVIPADEDAKPEYIEYEGDIYWVNENRRGELWINTKEKPRPIFRTVKAARFAEEAKPVKEEVVATSEPKPEAKGPEVRVPAADDRAPGTEAGNQGSEIPVTVDTPVAAEVKKQPAEPAPAGKLPEGAAVLQRIRPKMRRNRRGPGGSGSTSFLSRALGCSEADLTAAFLALGLVVPATSAEKPVFVEIGNEVWWLSADSRGGLWINGREKRPGETLAMAKAAETAGESASAPVPEPAPATSPTPAGSDAAVPALEVPVATPEVTAPASAVDAPPPPSGNVFAAVRLLLKATRTGGVAATVDRVAADLGKALDDLITTLVGAGLKVPEKPRERPVFVEHAGEIFWFNRNAKGELWLNAKASKFAEKKADAGDGAAAEATAHGGETEPGEPKPRRPRGRKMPE
jgi:hypothetical protein